MEQRRIDDLARILATRRSALGLVSLLGGVLLAGPGEAKRKKKSKKKGKKKPAQDCGSGCPECQTCIDGGCVSSTDGAVCSGGTCQNGSCRSNEKNCPADCSDGCCDAANGVCKPGGDAQFCGRNGEECTACGLNQACRSQHCCGANSVLCNADEDCCNSWACRQGQCCTLNGRSTSTTDPRCCEPGDEVNSAKSCCRSIGESCTAATSCCGLSTCVDNTCCVGPAKLCRSNAECCSGVCANVSVERPGTCCRPIGEACVVESDCCGYCVDGHCAICPTGYTYCNSGENGACCPNGCGAEGCNP